MTRNPRRPLLDLRRSDTVALCGVLDLAPVHDPSNDDRRFRRNRVRHELLPLLASIGASPRALVSLLTLVGGEEHLPGFYAARNRVYREWFGDDAVPGHSLAVVAALAAPGIHVEIAGRAAVPVAGPERTVAGIGLGPLGLRRAPGAAAATVGP